MAEQPMVPPGCQVFSLARGTGWCDTPVARWALAIAQRTGLPTDGVGVGIPLTGAALAELQARMDHAFAPPVTRIVLRQPLLAFRFYGDLSLPLTRLYTSLATVRQVPGFGLRTRDLLGLTGRNGADHLIAVRLVSGSQIAVGAISNRASWADQILVESDLEIEPIAHLAIDDLDGASGWA